MLYYAMLVSQQEGMWTPILGSEIHLHATGWSACPVLFYFILLNSILFYSILLCPFGASDLPACLPVLQSYRERSTAQHSTVQFSKVQYTVRHNASQRMWSRHSILMLYPKAKRRTTWVIHEGIDCLLRAQAMTEEDDRGVEFSWAWLIASQSHTSTASSLLMNISVTEIKQKGVSYHFPLSFILLLPMSTRTALRWTALHCTALKCTAFCPTSSKGKWV